MEATAVTVADGEAEVVLAAPDASHDDEGTTQDMMDVVVVVVDDDLDRDARDEPLSRPCWIGSTVRPLYDRVDRHSPQRMHD
jgi:hypothetical protein